MCCYKDKQQRALVIDLINYTCVHAKFIIVILVKITPKFVDMTNLLKKSVIKKLS